MKQFLDNVPNITIFRCLNARGGGKRIATFKALHDHLLKMKENDIVAIITSDSYIRLNREELSDYLENQNWEVEEVKNND